MPWKPVPYNTPEEDARITADAENAPDNPPLTVRGEGAVGGAAGSCSVFPARVTTLA